MLWVASLTIEPFRVMRRIEDDDRLRQGKRVERVIDVHNREVMIACNTLRTEIEYLREKHGVNRRIIWMESQLHNVPEKMARALQDALDEVKDADRVILGYANCGNVIQGLKSGDFELIVPRLDDCISLVFGSQAARTEYGSQHHALYFTDGWMDKGHNIIEEYHRTVEEHGEEDAQDIFDMMYCHYKTMAYLDTGLYDVEELMDRTRFLADMCDLEQRVEPGTLDYVERLVCGPWDEELFVVIGPHEVVPAWPFATPGSVL